MNSDETPVSQKDLADRVRESTEKNSQFFIIYLGLLVYVLATVFGTRDQMLLVPTQGIKLPLVEVAVPLLGFYLVAPVFVLAIHFNLLQNLESHHYKLMRWRDACGGEVPREAIPAFLFNYAYLERGSKMASFVGYACRELVLHSGPLALGLLLWRFTDYQSVYITSWHLLVFAVDDYLVWLTEEAFVQNERAVHEEDTARAAKSRLHAAIQLPLRRLRSIRRFLRHRVRTFWRRIFGLAVLAEVLAVFWLHFSAAFGTGPSGEIGPLTQAAFVKLHTGPEQYKTLASWFIPMISIDPNEPAWTPSKQDLEIQALLAGSDKTAEWWKKLGKGLNLEGRHLRLLDAHWGSLPKMKLDRDTQMQLADFHRADLRGAELAEAQLQGADLSDALLQGNTLMGAPWQGMNLQKANLDGAKLIGAQLQGANLSRASLHNAELGGAELQGAKLDAAELEGAHLSLPWKRALWLTETKPELGALLHLEEGQDAGARLQGADLRNAQLQGADLRNAELQGADLTGANLQGADLTGARLQGADLTNAKLDGAILGHTRLRGAILPAGKQIRVWSFKRLTLEEAVDTKEEARWKELTDLKKEIPGTMQEIYGKRIRQAWASAPAAEEKKDRDLAKKTKGAFSLASEDNGGTPGDLIGQWDENPRMRQDDLEAAACGLWRNAVKLDDESTYTTPLNEALCKIQRLRSLCQDGEGPFAPPAACAR